MEYTLTILYLNVVKTVTLPSFIMKRTGNMSRDKQKNIQWIYIVDETDGGKVPDVL